MWDSLRRHNRDLRTRLWMTVGFDRKGPINSDLGEVAAQLKHHLEEVAEDLSPGLGIGEKDKERAHGEPGA